MAADDLHHIHVGPGGTFAPSGAHTTTPAQIDALFAKMKQEDRRQMIIYFHGGLVGEKSGMQTAGDLAPVFSEIQAQPAFFIWETGPWETIKDNLPKILRTRLVSDLLKYVLGQVAKRWVGVDVAGKGPGETLTFEEIEAELAQDRPFEDWDQASDAQGGAKGGPEPLTDASLAEAEAEIALELAMLMGTRSDELESAAIAAADNELLSEEIRQDATDITAKGFDLLLLVRLATLVAVRVLRRYLNGLDHGLYPTVVEEILREVGLDGVGKFLWDAMKDKAAAMWAADPVPPPADPTQRRVGAYFLEQLVAYAHDNPGFSVDLVGHSAGSIAIFELLKAADENHPGFRFGRIALLAPGARMELFVSEIVAHPERYDQLRIYTMKDELELQDAIAGKLYPLSLLFFVSGVLEDPPAAPLCGLARCLSGSGAYSDGDAFLAHKFVHIAGADRLVLSITGPDAPPGLRSNSFHHGDFDNTVLVDGTEGETVISLKTFLLR
jgi:hypothetical protein